MHSYREAYLACYQPTGDADQEVSGDEVRHHLNDSVLPRLATEGWILDTGPGYWQTVRPRVAWWGPAPEERQTVYDALLGSARRAVQRAKSFIPQRRQGQPARRARSDQELQGPPGGGRCQRSGGAGRDRRAAGPQRGGKDHDLLPYYGPHPAGRRPRSAGRGRAHRLADVPAGAQRHRLSGAGALGLPQDDGRGEHSSHPGDPRSRAGTSATAGWSACWTSCRSSTCARARRTP